MTKVAEALLTLPDAAQRQAYLRGRDLWQPTVLADLLALGETWAQQEPERCRRLAKAVAELADQMPAPLEAARARYLQAQAHAILGEFATALPLIATARTGYLAQGRTSEAARTYVGAMHVLAALGRHEEALAAGEAALKLAGSNGLLPALIAQNQGLIYHRQGRFDEALEAYSRAAAIYGELGETLRQGQALNNQGVVLHSLGRGAEAVEAFAQAEAAFAAGGASLLAAQARSNQGAARLLLGHYQQALADFEAARQALEGLDRAEMATLLLDTATAYLALNLYPEALNSCEQALAAFRHADRPYEIGQALLRRAAALQGLRRLAEAEGALEEAAARFTALGNAPWEAVVRLEQAGLWQRTGQYAQARQAAATTLSVCQAHGMVIQQVYAHLRLAVLADSLDSAEEHLQAARRQADELGVPTLRYRALAGLGALRRRQGRSAEARRLLTAAVELLESQRATLAHELLRVSFLSDKGRPYEHLVALYLEQGDVDGLRAAFEAAERGRSRALLDRLGPANAGPRPSTAADDQAEPVNGQSSRPETAPRTIGAHLSEQLLTPGAASRDTRSERAWSGNRPEQLFSGQLEKLSADLDGLYSALLASDLDASLTGEQRAARRQALFSRIRQIEQELANLRLRLASSGGEVLDVGQAATLDQTLAALPADTALVAYQRIDDEWLAFVVEPSGLRVVRQLCRTAALAKELDRLTVQWGRFRFGADHIQRHRDLALRSTLAVLGRLYDWLVRPLDIETSCVIVAPQGPLHSVPFHALYDGRAYWLERVEVSYTPSASLLVSAQARPRRSLRCAAALGLTDAGIPQVAGELQAVAAAFPGARLLRDAQATRDQLWQAAAGCDLLHVACHGVFRADNPLFSALRLADGWLTAADADRMPLAAEVVTLSACESGRSRVAAGDELLGMARPFLGRARSLVVSLWLVHDETAARLMERFYRQLAAGQRPAAALRRAQLMTLAEEPHPYYWAPFIQFL